jgi:hypothetical protein
VPDWNAGLERCSTKAQRDTLHACSRYIVQTPQLTLRDWSEVGLACGSAVTSPRQEQCQPSPHKSVFMGGGLSAVVLGLGQVTLSRQWRTSRHSRSRRG